MLKSIFLEKSIPYDGTALCSGWIKKQTGIEGDAVISFIGGADVPIEHMVDLEDVARNAPIFSELMLHFIIEIADTDLEKMVLRQRLLIAILKDELQKFPNTQNIRRSGNDLYDGKAKLSVSVATSSPKSCLIHTAINILHENTSVLTKGLSDYEIAPKTLAETVMKKFVEELKGVTHAQTKVRAVN
ncbi:MAG: DUF366 family protein [Deltaproteobacteria bacterium]|nr:DUF366 family protein [Deltaproteobacteria bacterium]